MADTSEQITKLDIIRRLKELESKADLIDLFEGGKLTLPGQIEEMKMHFITLAKTAKQEG